MFPSRTRQTQRLQPKFTRLQTAFDERRIQLHEAIEGIAVEQVVVLETAGSVENLYKAVVRANLQWLLDVDGDPASPDRDFRTADDETSATPTAAVPTKLYFVVSDQHAISELLSLWNRWRTHGAAAFARGYKPLAHLFEQLRDVRLWDIRDRLDEDTRSYWEERLAAGDATIRTEIELWYSDSDQKNVLWAQSLRALLQRSNSSVIDELNIGEIRYHGFLVDLSALAIQAILSDASSPLAVSGQVMFYRPQLRGMARSVGAETQSSSSERSTASDDPVVAILDGVPLQNHSLLGARIILDDPTNLGANAAAQDRVHGTSMASVVLHGDLSAPPDSLRSKVLMHPILVPDAQSHDVPRPEQSPPDRLLLDVIHIAVKRIVEGAGGFPAVAPSVRVVNLSIGDLRREFSRSVSPLARLIDWLAWKYQLLFVVPTGNLQSISHGIELNIPRIQLSTLNSEDRASLVVQAVEADTQFRRLLSPAESINAVTVGGAYSDLSIFNAPPDRFPIFNEPWPSPDGRFGPGFLRAIKPDLVAPSGRRLFREKPGTAHANATVLPVEVSVAPGILAAAPSFLSGQLTHVKYTVGTSNAAALASHAAAHAHASIVRLRSQPEIQQALPPKWDAVLLKAMIVHASHWPNSDALVGALRLDLVDAAERKRRMARLFGYGILDGDRARGCTDERATLIAAGEISADQGILYRVPLPPSLAARRIWRRLTVTLAWLTPINPQHRDYRRAFVWFSAKRDSLRVDGVGANWQAARRGTIQHEVWEGESAAAYGRDADVDIVVSCAADAGTLGEAVPYALCVSLEVAEGINIPIFQEIAQRVAVRVPVRVRQ